jgi:hypothetical protein
MDSAAFEAARAEERAAGDEGTFFTLVYNEQHAGAEEWFGARGWQADATPLADYLREVGRPLPDPHSEAAPMVDSLSLVSAVRD